MTRSSSLAESVGGGARYWIPLKERWLTLKTELAAVVREVRPNVVQCKIVAHNSIFQILWQTRKVQQQRWRNGLQRYTVRIWLVHMKLYAVHGLSMAETRPDLGTISSLQSSGDTFSEIDLNLWSENIALLGIGSRGLNLFRHGFLALGQLDR